MTQLEKHNMTQLETLTRLSSFDNELELESNRGRSYELRSLIGIWTDDAEQEGNDLIGHVECALCYESDEVQKYFKSQGFEF
tara:strand:+ start:110 stop:355 length:246 start_codon:yes stop_codon:yes gene_type:complete